MAPTPSPTRSSWRARLTKHITSVRAWLAARDSSLSWGAICVGGLGGLLALWPLITTAWSLLGLDTAQTWRLAGAGVCALLLAAGVARTAARRTTPIRLLWLILVAWLIAIGLVAALTSAAWLILGTPTWDPPAALSPRSLDAIVIRAFAIVAGLGGVALLVIHYRRQRTTEDDAKRADAAATREVSKLFHERYASAYADLGSEHAAVRLGAVNALAHLVDDAPSEQEAQTVIDVLCAYLRMPYAPRPDPLPEPPAPFGLQPVSPFSAVDLGHLRTTGLDAAQYEKQQTDREEYQKRTLEFESFQQVRHTIIRIIGHRLREKTRWRGKNFDFTGVVFDGGDFSGAHFTGGRVLFSGARFEGGEVVFSGARFMGGEVLFDGSRFEGGRVLFSEARFEGSRVVFTWSRFEGGRVVFSGARFAGGEVLFAGARFMGGEVLFDGSRFEGGRVVFSRARFAGGEVAFVGARFMGGEVLFAGAGFSGGEVTFFGAQFAGGEVAFAWARFAGGRVLFTEAQFKGGQVLFSGARFMGGEVLFTEARFTGSVVVFSRARFVGSAVSFKEAHIQSGWMLFEWGGFTVDLAWYRDTYGRCPEGLMEAQEQAPARVVLAPAAWAQE